MSEKQFVSRPVMQLDVLAEENPVALVDNIQNLGRQYYDNPNAIGLLYYKAKALVTLKRYQEAEKIANDLIGKAILNTDFFILVKCYIILSNCYRTPESQYKIRPSLELAEEYARASTDIDLLTDVLSHLGSHYAGMKDLKTALTFHTKAIDLCKSLPPSLTVISVLMKAATLHKELMNFEKVLQLLTQALHISEVTKINFIRFVIINNLASTLIQLKKFRDADDLLNRTITECSEDDNDSQVLKLTYTLGVSKTHQEKYNESIAQYNRCLEISNRLGMTNPAFYIDIYNNLAVCFGMLGNDDESITYLSRAEDIAQKLGNQVLFNQISVNKANVFSRTNRINDALLILAEAAKFYKNNKMLRNLIVVQKNIALLHEKAGDLKKAIKVYLDIDKTYTELVNQILKENTASCDDLISSLSTQSGNLKTSSHFASNSFQKSIGLDFIGQSEAYRKVLNSALLAAQHPKANVFIIGESGTGKEIIANIIHRNSLRRDFPFIPVNTSAIATGLIESEFFGHTKGAFTGASSETKGLFLQSNKGTLYLDEITEMPIEYQAKLLRAIESKKIIPVGSDIEVEFDNRIISSTNRNIYEELESNSFRLDLFHRLNTIEIFIPPLRDRTDDIELLLFYFIDIYTMETKRTKPQIDASFINKLKSYSFPGNIRELKNIVERLFILCDKNLWDEGVLSLVNQSLIIKDKHHESLSVRKVNEKELITKALIKSNGKQKEAARLLEMSESTLTRRIVKFGLEAFTKRGS